MKISADSFKYVQRRYTALDNDFEPYKAKGLDIQRFVCPWRGRFLSGDSEQDAKGEIYDDTSIHNSMIFRAVRVAAAGIKNGISPESRPWFRVTGEDEKVAEFAGPAAWLSRVQELIYMIARRSNTYAAFQDMDTENVVFGTCSATVLPDYQNVLRMKSHSFGEYRLGQDYRGVDDTFAWKFYKSVGNLVEEFGEENVMPETLVLYNQGHLEKMILVYGLVEPNDDRIDLSDALGRGWRSVYWESGAQNDTILAVRGFDEFPNISAGWERIGSAVYGIGPGHENLRDAKRLQKLEGDDLQNLALQNRPALFSDAANKDTVINAAPWGITRGADAASTTHPGIRTLYDVKHMGADLQAKIQDTEEALRSGFYNDIFMMISNQAESIDTAYQAARMMEEKYSILGPVIERSQKMRGDWIKLAFHYALEAGLIPPAPPELQGQELKIQYISTLALAQQIAGLSAINETMAFVERAATIWPGARHKFDAVQAVDEVARVNGVPPSVIRSDDEVAALVAQDAQMAQAQARGQAMLSATEGAKNLEGVEMQGRSAVDVLSGALPGGGS
jgi:hypothetical protein